jgi:hypothetical protein
MRDGLDYSAELEYVISLDEKKNIEQMTNEGCPNVIEGLIERDIDKAAPVLTEKKHRIDVKHFDLLTVRPFLKTQNARLTRKRYAETSIREYLSQIEPNTLKEKYLEFYDSHPFYKEVCAGAKHHHWWKGGLEDHVREMIGVGMDIMDLYPGDFSTFTKTDVIIVCFLHDFDKIWLYRYLTNEDRAQNPTKFKENQVFTYTVGATDIMDGYSLKLLELARHGLVPTDQQWSAILFHEGGYSAANFDFRGATKTGDTVSHANLLAPFIHILDMYSAMMLGRSIA